MIEYWDRPCAAAGLQSYRYRGRFGYIMIGAMSDADALKEAARSTTDIKIDHLERWDGSKYVAVTSIAGAMWLRHFFWSIT